MQLLSGLCILETLCYWGITSLTLTDSFREFLVLCLVLHHLKTPFIHLLTHSPLQQILTKCLLCAGRCPRCWRHQAEFHQVSALTAHVLRPVTCADGLPQPLFLVPLVPW